MTFKKIIIIFLLILSIFTFFNFSSVHAENINVTSSSAERMKADIDYLKQLLKNNNINNINELALFLDPQNSIYHIQYFYIQDAGHPSNPNQYAYFYNGLRNISFGTDKYSYYGVLQNSFTLRYNYGLKWDVAVTNKLTPFKGFSDDTKFIAPSCWLLVRTVDLFTMDSSQIVSNAIGNVDNSINNLNDKLTEDNSNQDDINLNSHNNEMNNASDSIKNSNLYNKFSKLSNELQEAFTYDDNDVTTLPVSFNNKNVVLKSNEISKFFLYNNLGFVITLWQSILWFSLFYTMFIFIRKLYKSVTGGNPVDDVQKTLSSEDNKMVGGF